MSVSSFSSRSYCAWCGLQGACLRRCTSTQACRAACRGACPRAAWSPSGSSASSRSFAPRCTHPLLLFSALLQYCMISLAQMVMCMRWRWNKNEGAGFSQLHRKPC